MAIPPIRSANPFLKKPRNFSANPANGHVISHSHFRSGRGSNAEALLKAEQTRQLGGAQIAALVSDQAEAGILELGDRFFGAGPIH